MTTPSSPSVCDPDCTCSPPLFLGIDCSSQSLKCVLLCVNGVVVDDGVAYDKLGLQGIVHGSYGDGMDDPHCITAPTLTFIAALEHMLHKLAAYLPRVQAIGGSGQQHGSVYWRHGGSALLAALTSSTPLSTSLTQHFQSAFSIPNGPMWMDSSTRVQCDALEAVISPAELAQLSGSRAHPRFTFPQLLKLRTFPQWQHTERVSLISSFLTSLLCGQYVGIEMADAAGMNLLNINTRQWEPRILAAALPSPSDQQDMLAKLGSPVLATSAQPLAHHFISRYGFPSSCAVLPVTGDNPATLLGCELAASQIMISLGTSDTLLATTHAPRAMTIGHLFPHPSNQQLTCIMLCIKNGSLAREQIRNHLKLTWADFSAILDASPPGNNSCLLYHYPEPEIAPSLTGVGTWRFDASGASVHTFDVATEVRGIIEGQVLNYKLYASKMGLSTPARIVATGGASANASILQIIADIFEAPVYVQSVDGHAMTNTAAYGAALLARQHYTSSHVAAASQSSSLSDPHAQAVQFQCVAQPRAQWFDTYRMLLKRFDALQQQVIQQANGKSATTQ